MRDQNVYMQVFDELRNAVLSIFIRSYVYVVFVKVKARRNVSKIEHEPNVEDVNTYNINTEYDIKKAHPSNPVI